MKCDVSATSSTLLVYFFGAIVATMRGVVSFACMNA
jgi:hypothetical protein